jgi:hypothetical protein
VERLRPARRRGRGRRVGLPAMIAVLQDETEAMRIAYEE